MKERVRKLFYRLAVPILVGMGIYFYSSSAWAYVYWMDNVTEKIQRSNDAGQNIEDILSVGGAASTMAVYYTPSLQKIYWGQSVGTPTIQRANLDGSSPETILNLTGGTADIAFDYLNSKLYYIDSDANDIRRSDLDGSNSTIIAGASGTAIALAVDPLNNYIYYVSDGANDNIFRMPYDGSTNEGVISAGNIGISHLAIDQENEKLYWTELTTQKVRRSDLDGSNAEDLITLSGANTPQPYDIDIDFVHDEIFYTVLRTNGGDIYHADLDGSNNQLFVTGLSAPVAGLSVVNPELPPGMMGYFASLLFGLVAYFRKKIAK